MWKAERALVHQGFLIGKSETGGKCEQNNWLLLVWFILSWPGLLYPGCVFDRNEDGNTRWCLFHGEKERFNDAFQLLSFLHLRGRFAWGRVRDGRVWERKHAVRFTHTLAILWENQPSVWERMGASTALCHGRPKPPFTSSGTKPSFTLSCRHVFSFWFHQADRAGLYLFS